MLYKQCNKIVVVDIESTCWKGKIPNGQLNEVIEIGMAVLSYNIDKNRWETQSLIDESIFVIPTKSTISQFCTELTGITHNTLKEKGVHFKDTIKKINGILGFDARKYPWASYGEYDHTILRQECKRYSTQFPFSNRHINIKTIVSIFVGAKQELSLKDAMHKMGLSFSGIQHRASIDASNIAKLFETILNR